MVPGCLALQILHFVAAAVVHDGQILACRRKRGPSAGGLWEFPGGKIDPDERPADALAREILEELDVAIEVGELLHRVTTLVDGMGIDLHGFRATLKNTVPTRSTDHRALRWLRPAELHDLDWAPPDWPLHE